MIEMPLLGKFMNEAAASITAFGVVAGMIVFMRRKIKRAYRKLSVLFTFLVDEDDGVQQRIIRNEFRARMHHQYAKYGIYECNKDGECIFANGKLAELFGLEMAEMHGRGWLSAIRHDERERVWEKWKSCIEKSIPYEDVYYLTNGKTVKTLTQFCKYDDKPILYIGSVWEVGDDGAPL